jgi:hypothetical protein
MGEADPPGSAPSPMIDFAAQPERFSSLPPMTFSA